MQHHFKAGDKVRVIESSLNSYYVEFQKKVKGGRVGVVRGYPVGRFGQSKDPIVWFPAWGRRKEYAPGQISIRDLELVEAAQADGQTNTETPKEVVHG